MSNLETTTSNETTQPVAATEQPVALDTSAPSASTTERKPIDLAARKAAILASALSWPAYDGKHEALFDGNAEVEILRAKLGLSSGGSKMIWIEGVVVGTCKLDIPPSQYSAENPEGWDMILYSEENKPLLDETGAPVLDDNGVPKQYRPKLGHGDATGYRFVYGGTLSDGMAAEMCVNNATFLGWRPDRVKAPCTGTSFADFVPPDGQDSVSAELLGMTGRFKAHFKLKPAEGNFAPRVQLVAFKLLDVRVKRSEAESLDKKFEALLGATRDGTKFDSRKQAKAAPAGTGPFNFTKASAKGDKGGDGASSGKPTSTKLCGKLCGEHKEPCTEPQGHAGPCTPPPF